MLDHNYLYLIQKSIVERKHLFLSVDKKNKVVY